MSRYDESCTSKRDDVVAVGCTKPCAGESDDSLSGAIVRADAFYHHLILLAGAYQVACESRRAGRFLWDTGVSCRNTEYYDFHVPGGVHVCK